MDGITCGVDVIVSVCFVLLLFVLGQRASMYRVTGDFHANNDWTLSGHAFALANLSAPFAGANDTWPDGDMLDLGRDSPWHGPSRSLE